MNILEIYVFASPVVLVLGAGYISWRVSKTGTPKPSKPKDPSPAS